MKKQIRFLMLLCVMVSVTFHANAFSYYISFTGSGASTTVDSIIVQNLYKSTQVKVPAGFWLRLYDVETSLDRLNTITDFACVYPNPTTENATFSFVAKNKGKTQITVYGIDGKKVTGLDLDLLQEKNSFQLTLPKGVYLVQAIGNGFSYSTKAISLRMADCQPVITFISNSPESKLQKAPNPAIPEVKLQYTQGDQILYKGYSGNFCTIVTDKPTESKTTDFKFVDCTDADGNHYAVVHIGTQTWMAENLKTTKYRNAETIANQWAYNDDMNNAAKYGRLYTWYAATDSRNIAPVGWHVATDEDWITLSDFHGGDAVAGGKLKESGTSNWSSPNVDATNETGFTALPGGYRLSSGSFDSVNIVGLWWTSTQYDLDNAWFRDMYYLDADLPRINHPKSYGFSVRCVRD